MSNTKTCYLDANILVFFKDSSSDHHNKAVDLIERLVKENYKLYISSLILDEFLYVAIYYLRRTKEKDFETRLKNLLSSILKIPNLEIVNPPTDKKDHLKIIDFVTKFFLRPRDAYHLLTIKTNKIQYFATFDKDFDKVFESGVVKKIR